MNKWFLKNGERVDDRFNSHVHARIENLITEALVMIDSHGRDFIEEAVDFGRPIGETICVTTDECDQIVFAKRPRRGGHSRFVLGRQPEPCSSLMLVLKAISKDKQEFLLITAFVGYKPQPEPWDERYFSQQRDPIEAKRKAQVFWANHALIWGGEEIIVGTETSVCQW